ncbi:MAG: MG2 domain-containing protein [Candidatus Eremiobacterota bacterium]
MKKYISLFFLLSLILIFTLSCRRNVPTNQDNSDSDSNYNENSLGIIIKASGKDLLLFVQDRMKGKPLSNVNLEIDTRYEQVTTDENGMVLIKDIEKLRSFGRECEIIARWGDRKEGTLTFDIPTEQKLLEGYIYTDRPVYRPGQKVNFKSIIRTRTGDSLVYSPEENISVTIDDPDGKNIYSRDFETDKYGTISDSFTLSQNPALGDYIINCTTVMGVTATGTFQVQEYRKPEFEISVTPSKDHYVYGETITFNIDTKYYFGSPVSEKDFTYKVHRMPCSGNSMAENFLKSDEALPYREGKGVTDKYGRAAIVFKSDNTDAYYNVTVKMTDQSRREVTGTSGMMMTKNLFRMTVTPDRSVCKPKEKVNIKIDARDYKDKPVQNNVTLNIKSDVTEALQIQLKTDGNGSACYDFIPHKDGCYEVEVISEDQNKNQIKACENIYCYSGDSNYYWWKKLPDFHIIPDKKVYNTGDRARIFLVSPCENVKALLTVEREDIIEKKIIDFTNRTAMFEMDIKEKHSPNVYVTVSFFYKDNFYSQFKEISCPSKDKFLTVSIEPDREKYSPGDEAKISIKTIDKNNNPATSQVSMGLIDESLYALMHDPLQNIHKFFYDARENNVMTYQFNCVSYAMEETGATGGIDDMGVTAVTGEIDIGYMGETGVTGDVVATGEVWESPTGETCATGEAAPTGEVMATGDAGETALTGETTGGRVITGSKGEEGSNNVKPAFVRNFFPDTVYFNPSIITDEHGMAEITVPLPHSLTTWRATAKAVTEKTEVGENTRKIITSKNLLARLITPRFFTVRDETVITGIIHNYLNSDKTVRLKMETEGHIECSDKRELTLKIPAGGSRSVDWKIKVKIPGDCKIKLTALTDEESDAVELSVPVLPHGTIETVSASGFTNNKWEKEFFLSKKADESSAACVVILEKSIASSILSCLEYLTVYPYGCTEQTMDKFLPCVIVADTLRELRIKNEKLDKELPGMVKSGLSILYGYQHKDGGWGWWEHDKSHPYMTAYVVYGLIMAKKAGYEVDKHIVEKGIDWLEENYGKEHDLNTRAYMAFSIICSGGRCDDYLLDLYKNKDRINSYSKAVLAISLKEAGFQKEAEEMASLIEKTAEREEKSSCWSGRTGSHGWTDSKIETTSYCLKALLYIKRDSKLIAEAVRYITTHRNGNCWYSTKDTAAAVMAFTDYMRITGTFNSSQTIQSLKNFQADLYINGRKIKTVNFSYADAGEAGKKIEIPFGQGIIHGKNMVKIQVNGPGGLYYSCYLTYYTEEEHLTGKNSGFKIDRHYYLFNNGNKEEIKKDGTGALTVKSQDIILEELNITGKSDYEYFIIEDPKPSGCEYELTEADYHKTGDWYSHREFRDEKCACFATHYSKGSKKITYKLRAETPGIFHVMPARAGLMYGEGIEGSSDELILKISEK